MLYVKNLQIAKPKKLLVLIILAGLTNKIDESKTILQIKNQCAFVKHRTILPTLPVYNLATILTGAPLEFHGITDFKNTRTITPTLETKYGLYPTIFYSLKEQKPDFTTAFFTNNVACKNLIESDLIDNFVEEVIYDDINLVTQNLTVIYDHDLFKTGVTYGFNSNNYERLLEEKIIAINNVIARNNDVTFIITSTNGGVHQGLENQGGLEDNELLIPLKIIDQEITTEKFHTPTSNTDIATLIAYLMNFDLVQGSTTRIINLLDKGIFNHAT